MDRWIALPEVRRTVQQERFVDAQHDLLRHSLVTNVDLGFVTFRRHRERVENFAAAPDFPKRPDRHRKRKRSTRYRSADDTA
jgi:hypothetical protein